MTVGDSPGGVAGAVEVTRRRGSSYFSGENEQANMAFRAGVTLFSTPELRLPLCASLASSQVVSLPFLFFARVGTGAARLRTPTSPA